MTFSHETIQDNSNEGFLSYFCFFLFKPRIGIGLLPNNAHISFDGATETRGTSLRIEGNFSQGRIFSFKIN